MNGKLPKNIQWVEDLEAATELKALIYGPSGSGKTTCACTAPDPIIALTEFGRSSRRIKAMSKILEKQIPVSLIRGTRDMETFVKTMATAKKKMTIVFDSATDFYRVIINEIVGKKLGASIPGKGDWQIIQSLMERTLRDLVNLPHNVIVLAHQKEYVVKERGEEVRRIVPGFSGDAMPTFIGKLFQAVGYCFKRRDADTGKVRYFVAFDSEDRILTKRDDGLSQVDAPNITKWIESVNSAYETGTHDYQSNYDQEYLEEVDLPTSKEVSTVLKKDRTK